MPEKPDSDRDVLTSLPRTRPARRSAKRDGAKAKAAAKPKARAAAKPKAAAQARTAAKATPETARKPRAKAKAKANVKAKAKPKAAPKPANGARADRPASTPQRKVPPAGYAAPASRATGESAPGPTEVVTTAVQAAGELAQIGITVGRQALKSALGRLPRP